MFRNRNDAAIQLASALQSYQDQDVIVFALPRGGVVLGVEIAKRLNAPLDLVFTKKIGHPQNPELAIGAISEDGIPIIDAQYHLDDEWLSNEIKQIKRLLSSRREAYLGHKKLRDIADKTIILVDDGVATGYTMRAAIASMKGRGAAKIVVAVPVVDYLVANRLRDEADELVALIVEQGFFGAVSTYYDDFEQVEDDQVKELLANIQSSDQQKWLDK